jgi:hypothetical protein
MKHRRVAISALTLSACVASLLLPCPASAQEVRLENVSFDQVLTELFGTPEIPGLLDGQKKFKLHAERVTLTRKEASSFFGPGSPEVDDLGDLIAAAGRLQGTELRIKGLRDGSPFELKLSGNQVKLDGISLTQAHMDAVVEQLQGISGLPDSTIDATVDGRPIVVRIGNTQGRAKRDPPERVTAERIATTSVERVARPERIQIEPLTKVEKPVKLDRIRIGRIERDDDGGGRRDDD